MTTLSARPGALPYGLLLIALGLTALVLSRDIRVRSHVGESDPGPRFLPRLMAAGMVGGGAILVIGSFLSRRKLHSPSPGTPGEGGGEGRRKDEGGRMKDELEVTSSSSFILQPSAFPPSPHPHPLPEYRARGSEMDRGTLDAILLLISLPIYLLLLPLAGFFISTWVYSTVMMIRLRMKPLLAMLLASGMMVVVWALFVWQFRVVLPRGPSWMPF